MGRDAALYLPTISPTPATSRATQISSSKLSQLLNYLSLNSHYESFAKGLFSLSDLLYYLSLIGLLLFLTVRSLETRRWR